MREAQEIRLHRLIRNSTFFFPGLWLDTLEFHHLFYFSLKKRNYLLSGTVLCLWLCTANVLSCFLWGMSSCFSPLLCIHPSYRLFLFVMSCPLSYCIYFFNEARTSLVHCLCLLLFILARLQLCLFIVFINATKLN